MNSVVQSGAQAEQVFSSKRLEQVFTRCFEAEFSTRLVGGAIEPLYQPAQDQQQLHSIFYRNDYFASALHEVAHWCLAGAARHERVDYGYWYASDGRDTFAQRAFESVEYKPQALEWIFARASGWRFRISVDNLEAFDGSVPDTGEFSQRILAQVHAWQAQGLPSRAQRFFDALLVEFSVHHRSAAVVSDRRFAGADEVAAGDLSALVFTLAELQ